MDDGQRCHNDKDRTPISTTSIVRLSSFHGYSHVEFSFNDIDIDFYLLIYFIWHIERKRVKVLISVRENDRRRRRWSKAKWSWTIHTILKSDIYIDILATLVRVFCFFFFFWFGQTLSSCLDKTKHVLSCLVLSCSFDSSFFSFYGTRPKAIHLHLNDKWPNRCQNIGHLTWQNAFTSKILISPFHCSQIQSYRREMVS